MSVGARWISGVAVTAVIALLGFTGLSIPPVHAQSNGQSEVQIGLNISPVTLNMKGRNPSLVGKGSFIVNAKGDCNGCHNSPDLGGEFAEGHNPYFGQPKQINANGYLGGGEQFGPFPGVGPGGVGPLIIYPRNLTPDISGRPIGGATFQEFQAIMRIGHDFDSAHPACPTLGVLGCLASPPPAPFDATLLQVMPWPVFANMSDDDLRAIYEYLSAIPCISHAGTPGLPAILYQTCPL
jgi:hypothetical protein